MKPEPIMQVKDGKPVPGTVAWLLGRANCPNPACNEVLMIIHFHDANGGGIILEPDKPCAVCGQPLGGHDHDHSADA